MTGNANSTTKRRSGWLTRLQQVPQQYFAVDGGYGAHLLAALTERHPYVKQVASPRHADLLLIIEPVCQKLAPALIEVARALPRPAHVLLMREIEDRLDHFPHTKIMSFEDIFPGAQSISTTSAEAVLDAMLHPQSSELAPLNQPEAEETTISLPPKNEQEMASELVVLSLGPVQPFTAGPLRLFLICDGEQVLSVQMETGYAYRAIEKAMLQADWQQVLPLARQLDPLAPLTCQLACVNAIEQLQGWQPPTQLVKLRHAAVALERVQNVLWWLVRFVHILADPQLLERSYRLATSVAAYVSQLWQPPPSSWILPQQGVTTPLVANNTSLLQQLADEVEALRKSVERNRLLALRTQGIGMLSAGRLKSIGASGPILQASEQSYGDAQSRLLARLDAATLDLREVREALSAGGSASTHVAQWHVPAGEASTTVKGPRGTIDLHLRSDGGEKPTHVEWQRPSAVVVQLLPEVLVGQKLADAEVVLASLDLSMAEADG